MAYPDDWAFVDETQDYWTAPAGYIDPHQVVWDSGSSTFKFYSNLGEPANEISFDYGTVGDLPTTMLVEITVSTSPLWQVEIDYVYAQGEDYGIRVNLNGSSGVIGTALIPIPEGVDLETNPTFSVEVPLDFGTGGDVVGLELVGENNLGSITVSRYFYLTDLQFYGDQVKRCYEKPAIKTYIPGERGYAAYPGQPYRPAYCEPSQCVTVTTRNASSSSGSVSQSCTTGSSGLVNSPPTTICTTTYVRGSSTFGNGSSTSQVCSPPVCYPEQPYIPPAPAIPPTPSQTLVDYDLGWNYDVLLGARRNISLDIATDDVPKTTSGVIVGIAPSRNWGQSGFGKYAISILFEGDDVSVFTGATRVWGPTYRADDHVFTLEQYESQLSVLRDGVVVYSVDSFGPGEAVIGATIYKGGDGFCFLENPTSAATLAIGDGGASITLPPFSVIAADGAYGTADIELPAITVDAIELAYGGADVSIPAFFGIGSEGSHGWALAALPEFSASGYASDSQISYADVELPAFSSRGYDGSSYADGDALVPEFTVAATGGYVIPVAEGADVFTPAFMFAGHGLTGQIGGVEVELPVFDAVGADRPVYGEAVLSLPAFSVFAIEAPVYDGIIFGDLPGLEVQDFYGHSEPLNAIDGYLEDFDGDLEGGAYLSKDLPALAGELTGTMDVVGRLDGTFQRMTMNSTGLTGMYGEIAGNLGEPIDGELLAGAFISGSIPGLVGELVATAGATGVIDGTFQGLAGQASGTWLNTGRLDATLPAIEALWGILGGDLPGLAGGLVQAAVTIDSHVAWVMNMKTGAVSRYPDYESRFLCRWRDGNYVIKSDGVYRVGGDLDVDQPIDAGFTLPASDFGISTIKMSPRLYLQGDIGGQFAVTTTVDEGASVTTTSNILPGVGYKRCKLARGIRGTQMEFAVDNVDGADFEIEQVDALVANTGRKI